MSKIVGESDAGGVNADVNVNVNMSVNGRAIREATRSRKRGPTATALIRDAMRVKGEDEEQQYLDLASDRTSLIGCL